jgi:hypothetical protein
MACCMPREGPEALSSGAVMWKASPVEPKPASSQYDLRAAGLGVAEFFDDQHARALAHHEAVAVLVERAAGVWGLVGCGGSGRAWR